MGYKVSIVNYLNSAIFVEGLKIKISTYNNAQQLKNLGVNLTEKSQNID